MKKRLICAILLVVLALTFVLVACNGNNDDGIITTGELKKDENGNVIFEEVELKLTSVVTGIDRFVLNQLVARFNAEYRDRINVTVSNIDESTFEDTVSKQITNNYGAPDIIMSHQKSHMSFMKTKLTQPFDEAMERSGITIDLGAYSTGLAQYAKLGTDKLYGVPVDGQSMAVLYNKKLLAQYNDGKVPTTRAELIEVCKKAKNGGVDTPIAWMTENQFYTSYLFPTAVIQNGGHLYGDNLYADWYNDVSNRAAIKNAISSLRDMIQVEGIAKHAMNESEAIDSFYNGESLFLFYVPWKLSDVVSNYCKGRDLTEEEVRADYFGGMSIAGLFALDESNANANKIFGDSHFFAMSRTVTDITKKAAICEFAKWFTQNTSVGAKWGEAGHFSACTDVNTSEEYNANEIVSEYIKKFYPDINNFVCIGNTPYYSAISQNLTAMWVSAVAKTGNSQDDAIIKKSQDDANAIIDFVNA